MNKNRQCKYCNRIIKDKQWYKDIGICASCYTRLRSIRWFMRALEPLRKLADQRLIDGVEFTLDNNLSVNPEHLKRYYNIIEERKKECERK